MKAIITDLDNTMWGGLIGDLQVSMDGIYKQYQVLLKKLSEEGVLIGVSSKNDPNNTSIELVLSKLAVPREAIYPVICNYSPKSVAIQSILDTWNISAKDVLFIDDSMYELMEVKESIPEIHVLRFMPYEPFFMNIREYFPKKDVVTKEDKLRVESIRQNMQFIKEKSNFNEEEFFDKLGAEITVKQYCNDDPRVLELVQKTNQFRLNGMGIDQTRWNEPYLGERTFAYSYCDKFGDLGTIAVVRGYVVNWTHSTEFVPRVFCMSCRAFGRRIEYKILDHLYTIFDFVNLKADFAKTDKNKPMEDFIDACYKRTGGNLDQGSLSRHFFRMSCPELYFNVVTD